MKQSDLAKSVGKIPSGVFVAIAGQRQAPDWLLASWVQQVSFEPMQLMVSVKKGRAISGKLRTNAVFALHVIGEEQDELYRRFVRRYPDGETPFDHIQLRDGAHGTLWIPESLAAIDCRVDQRIDVGDHELLICRALHGEVFEEMSPRIHTRKSGLSY